MICAKSLPVLNTRAGFFRAQAVLKKASAEAYHIQKLFNIILFHCRNGYV